MSTTNKPASPQGDAPASDGGAVQILCAAGLHAACPRYKCHCDCHRAAAPQSGGADTVQGAKCIGRTYGNDEDGHPCNVEDCPACKPRRAPQSGGVPVREPLTANREITMHKSTGTDAIAEERQRQMAKEGWTPRHDDGHIHGELAQAAACYALAPIDPLGEDGFTLWPWEDEWDKRPVNDSGDLREPTSAERRRLLVKAGALIAAEIDRLDRAATKGDNHGR